MNPDEADDLSPPSPAPVVEELQALGREASRARVRLSDGSEFLLAVDTVLELGLRSGDPVDEQRRAVLVDHDLHFRAREISLTLLSLRPRSRREMEDRLRKKQFPSRVVETVLDRLVEARLLDDAEFARAFTRDRLRLRPRGRRAIAAELARKGVARTVVDRVLDEVFEELETSDATLADRIAEAWVRRQSGKAVRALQAGPFDEEGAKVWRRGLGHLGRKGIGSGLARSALERALGEADEGV